MAVRILIGDVREQLATLPDESVHCCVTSPPYFGLRSYLPEGHEDKHLEIGLESSPAEYVEAMVSVFRDVRRVLRKDGVLFLNIGDSYFGGGGHSPGAPSSATSKSGKYGVTGALIAGHTRNSTVASLKPKDLVGIPWMLAFALRDDGWWLRSDIIWSKPNPMPESVTDRPTKAHEYLFLLAKSERYYYDAEAIREDGPSYVRHPGHCSDGADYHTQGRQTNMSVRVIETHGRNKRSVWTVATQPFSDWAETVRQVRVEEDALDGDKKRKASPDCPVHAGESDLVPKASYGGRVDAQLSRNGRSDADRGPSLPLDYAPIATHHEPTTAQQNSGSLRLSCSPSATPHSNESRRMDLVPETILPYTPSAEIPRRIGDTPTELASYVPNRGKPESNNAAVASADNRDSRTYAGIADRALESASSSASRTPRCTCEWYVEVIEKTSHFATFPPALIEPCILAGCPEKVCAKCGAPWVRDTVRAGWSSRPNSGAIRGSQPNHHRGTGAPQRGNMYVDVKTIGWLPSCDCDAPIIPGTVLDPFFGAGTTGLVADRLRRNSIGIELNPAYAEMARRRIEGDAGLFAEVAAE